MTFDELYDRLLADEKRLHDAKRNDYTGGADPLANYRAAADAVGLQPWQVMLSRLYEKAYRLKVLMGGTEQMVRDETIRDTCLDISVLSKLLVLLWEQSRPIPQ